MTTVTSIETTETIARHIANKFIEGDLAKHIERERNEFDETFEEGQEIEVDIDAEDIQGWKDMDIEILVGLYSGYFFTLNYSEHKENMVEQLVEAIGAFRQLEVNQD